MGTINLFEDPRYIHIQKVNSRREAPESAAGLDRIMGQQPKAEIVGLGEGMGYLTSLMHAIGYETTFTEPFEAAVNELESDNNSFFHYLVKTNRMFRGTDGDIVEFARRLTIERVGRYDGMYSNQGPLLIALTVEKCPFVESYVDNRVNQDDPILKEPSLELVLQALKGLRAGLKTGAPLILSVQPAPNDTHFRFYQYENGGIQYRVRSDYNVSGEVTRLRDLLGGGLEPIQNYKQKKFTIDYNLFKDLAREAGFKDVPPEPRGNWLVLRAA